MKVSIVHAVLNSHEILRRQFLYYNKLNLPSDVQLIIVDDGSDPPLFLPKDFELNFSCSLYATNDTRPWTQPAARNAGAKKAKGEYCIFTDIDHIITNDLLYWAYNPIADVIRFKREVAVLDENGDFTQDMSVLREWGFNRDRLRIAPHGNSYIFRRKLFLELGGVDEKYVGTGKYPNREEVPLKQKLKVLWEAGKITIIDDDTKPMIYMFPNGRYCGDKDFNPFGLFHILSRERNIGRKTNKQKYQELRGGGGYRWHKETLV